MTVTVVVDNDTGETLVGDGCGPPFQVVLQNDQYHPHVAFLTCLQEIDIPPGESTYEVTMVSSYDHCTHDSSQPPECVGPDAQTPPPLPPGDYWAALWQSPKVGEAPAPVLVHVTS